ncbi:MAG: hypothetical protein FWH02_08065 [Oscillospiraceae bacterium]|nr:hypothetical protein [Oscillospiraceae bacterium]
MEARPYPKTYNLNPAEAKTPKHPSSKRDRFESTLFKKEGKATARFILSYKKRKAFVGRTLFFKEGGAK